LRPGWRPGEGGEHPSFEAVVLVRPIKPDLREPVIEAEADPVVDIDRVAELGQRRIAPSLSPAAVKAMRLFCLT
jgi:hypothetical protein